MASLSPMQPCTPSTFSSISLFGAEILDVEAAVVTDYNFDIPAGWRYSQPSIDVQNATFCNVTVTYTHPSQNDSIVTETWLPVESWNGRLQSIGGGGWVAGRFYLTYAGMAGAIHDGYATATTDGGVGMAYTPASWGLVSPGNLDLVGLDDLGQTSLGDLVSIALEFGHGVYQLTNLETTRLPSQNKSSMSTLDIFHHSLTGTLAPKAVGKPPPSPNNSLLLMMELSPRHQRYIGLSSPSDPAGQHSTWI